MTIIATPEMEKAAVEAYRAQRGQIINDHETIVIAVNAALAHMPEPGIDGDALINSMFKVKMKTTHTCITGPPKDENEATDKYHEFVFKFGDEADISLIEVTESLKKFHTPTKDNEDV